MGGWMLGRGGYICIDPQDSDHEQLELRHGEGGRGYMSVPIMIEIHPLLSLEGM